MEILSVKILNPKAKRLLKEMVDNDLIEIDDSKKEFLELLKRLQSNSENVPTLEEITEEVEIVRKARYEQENNR
ncbi:hypothetical protein Aeqsu_2981 [Aequorivita sublithincola DSM 14238]|uniref:Uncharacterized protein n=1 Tax=Aequorivita sublithincola (strain DSM 14238 / LMG 21431 / ACAM 643 / 9-3) TaxID=746697 RepID=I3YZK2_AEQSU|nr:hypothetical protein [Aequorivita sublithincola]AFL82420.1 hypothetical protein Aeqsu_2981 [Aequorivita sublithincola DSM 14238]